MLSKARKLSLPSNLDLAQLLINHPATDFKGVSIDYLAYICHTINYLKAIHREDILKNNGMVPLSSKILCSHVYSYRACLDYLINFDILITDGSYIVGNKSIGYDFRETYIGRGFKKYFIKNPQFKRTLNEKSAEREAKNRQEAKTIKHLLASFDTGKLNIDIKQAYAWIEKSCSTQLNTLSQNSTVTKSEIKQTHDLYKLSVEYLRSGIYNCKLDDTGNRFHSALTNLKSELRNFLTYDNKQLVSIDIKNSQPYFSLLLLEKSFYSCDRDKDVRSLKKIYPELYGYVRKTPIWNKLKAYAEGNSGLSKRYISIGRFRRSVLEGKFYEDLIEFVRADSHERTVLTRDKAKKLTYNILFGNPQQVKNIPEYKTFKKNYTDLISVFEMFKSRPTDDNTSVRYNDLAILLQRIESYMVLNVITKKFHKSYPEAPLFTIHDCVITDLQHKDELTNIIEHELKKVIGTAPKLTEEYWVPEKAETEFPDYLLDQ